MRNDLYIFRYCLDLKRARKHAAENDEFLKKHGVKHRMELPVLDNIEKNMRTPHVIHTNLLGRSSILGRDYNIRNMMRDIKDQPDMIFDIFRYMRKEAVDRFDEEEEKIESYHIYDLIDQPKEMHISY